MFRNNIGSYVDLYFFRLHFENTDNFYCKDFQTTCVVVFS